MPWVRLDDQFPNHPKVVSVGPLAGWLHVCALCYCAQYLTDGFVPQAAIPHLIDVRGIGVTDHQGEMFARGHDVTVDELVGMLLAKRLWEEAEGGYQIHDYLEYNPSAEIVKAEREAAKERMRLARERKPKSKSDTFAGSSPEQTAKFAGSSPSPVPVPVPVPVSTDQDRSSSIPGFGKNVSAATTASGNGSKPPEIETARSLYLVCFNHANPQQQRDLDKMTEDVGPEIALEAVRWAARKGICDTDKIWSAALKMQAEGIGQKPKPLRQQEPREERIVMLGRHPSPGVL